MTTGTTLLVTDQVRLDGSTNSFVGKQAGQTVSTAVGDTFVGYGAGKGGGAAQTAGSNTAVGHVALTNIEGATTMNTAVGAASNGLLTTGTANTSVGYGAGYSCQTTFGSTNIGALAGYFPTGKENVFVGVNTGIGIAASTASENTAVGTHAMGHLTTGCAGNTAIGYFAGDMMTSGTYNVLVGFQSGLGFSTNSYNVAVGTQALNSLAAGDGNVAVGRNAGNVLSNGTYNVIIGYYAGSNAQALAPPLTHTVCIGYYAGDKLQTSFSTCIGSEAGMNLTGAGGGSAVCVGFDAGKNTTTASGDTYVGCTAGTGSAGSPNTGGRNTGIGYGTLYNIQGDGQYNVAVGFTAGNAVTTGKFNSLVGDAAGNSITTGTYNVCIGYSANCTGNPEYAIALGSSSGCSGNNGIAIGRSAAAVADSVALGRSAVATNATAYHVGSVAYPLVTKEHAAHMYYTLQPTVNLVHVVAPPIDEWVGSPTAVQFMGGLIVFGSGVVGGGYINLPTAASLIAAMPGCEVGHTLRVVFTNYTPGNLTIRVLAPDAGSVHLIGYPTFLTIKNIEVLVRITGVAPADYYFFTLINT